MADSIKIIRCPSCGSVQLNAKFSSPTSRKAGLSELFSLKYFINELERTTDPRLYWECRNCKTTFPMDNL